MELGQTLYMDTWMLGSDAFVDITQTERDTIQTAIDRIKGEYFDRVSSTPDGVKVNQKTHKADLDLAYDRYWALLEKVGATMMVAGIETFAVGEGLSEDDVKYLVEKCEQLLKEREDAAKLELFRKNNGKKRRKDASTNSWPQIEGSDYATDSLLPKINISKH